MEYVYLWPLVISPLFFAFFWKKARLCMPAYGFRDARMLGLFSFSLWVAGTCLFFFGPRPIMLFDPIYWFSAVAPKRAFLTFLFALITYYGLLLVGLSYLFSRLVQKKTGFSRLIVWYACMWMTITFCTHIVITAKLFAAFS